MAQQEEGWPLGLQPLNLRVGLARNCGFFGSASFNTLLSGSPTSSTDSSSDLDTESTGSFFHDKSISLGSLMGVSSIVDLPRRSTRGRSLRRHEVSGGCKKRCSSKTWCFSLCPRDNTDADQSSLNNNNTYSSSLGHFLAVERRAAANEHRRKSYSPLIYGPDDDELALARPDSQPNSLFVNGRVDPPASSPWLGSDFQTRQNREEDGDGFGSPLFSCICGQTIL